MHRCCAYSAHVLGYVAHIMQGNMNIRFLQENTTEQTIFAGSGSGSRVRSTWGTYQPPNYDSDYYHSNDNSGVVTIIIIIIIIIITVAGLHMCARNVAIIIYVCRV